MSRTKFVFDADKFASIRNRVADLYICEGDAIREKRTVHTTAFVFAEMGWLVDEIERIAGGPLDDKDKPRYAKIKRFVARVQVDYGMAIKAGEIIKVSADYVGSMRFLTRVLEEIVRMEDEDAIGPTEKLPPEEKGGRIQLDLEDGIEDSPEETEAALAAVGVSMEADEPVMSM